MLSTSSSIALAAVSAALLLAPSAHAQAPAPLAPGEVARVGDQPILKAEYDHWHAIQRRSSEELELSAAELRTATMQLLITMRSIDGEAALQKITLSTRQINAEYRRQKREAFGKNPEKKYRRFLRDTGQTTADVLVQTRMGLQSDRIRKQVVRGAKTSKGQQLRLDRFVKEFQERWLDVTVCGDGYDTDECGTVVPLSA